MMLFEIIFIFTILLSVLYCFNYENRVGGKICAIITALVSISYLLFEGYRWQLVPTYITSVFIILFLILGVKFKKKGLMSISIILLFLSAILVVVLPRFSLPETTGEFHVGTKYFILTDKAREEHFTKEKNDYREIVVKVWYPSESPLGINPEPYWEKGLEGVNLANNMGLPGFIFDYISGIKTNSYPEAEISDKQHKYPVLLFSHGYRSYASFNRVVMEELASHGYVIINITHPYEASVTKLSSGELVGISDEIIKQMKKAESLNRDVLHNLLNSETTASREVYAREFTKNIPIFSKSIYNWADDTKFILDKLPEIDEKYMSNSLDMDNIGIFGHSLGGSTAIEVAITDNRIKAAVNYDGLLSGSILNGKTLNKPFMMLNSEPNKNINDYLYKQLTGKTYIYTIRGSLHNDFTDNPLLSPLLSYVGMSGKISGKHVVNLTRDYTLAFFDKQFKDIDSLLLEGNSGFYSEVDVDLLQR
ncbi:MAG: dienelactone hydrolase family protein [Spirochaetaceae bacterium]